MKKAGVFIIICLVLAGVIAYFYQMGRLAGSYWKTAYEELEIISITFQTGNATISVRNTGTRDSRIHGVRVDDEAKPILATGGNIVDSDVYELAVGASGTITIGLSWTSGNRYTFKVFTSQGKTYIHSTTAPLGFSLSGQPIWMESWFWTVIGAVIVIVVAAPAVLRVRNRSIDNRNPIDVVFLI